MFKARSSDSQELPVGGVWVLDVRVTDADGCYASDTVTATVTLPNGTTSTPAVTEVSSGRYRAEYPVASVGRYIARMVGSAYGATDFTAYVTATVTAAAMPTIADLDTYLGQHSYSDDELEQALDAEAAAQRKACSVPAAYSDDLRLALLRRAQFALTMKKHQLGFVAGSDGDVVRPGRDSEVRRYEAPYRRLVTG